MFCIAWLVFIFGCWVSCYSFSKILLLEITTRKSRRAFKRHSVWKKYMYQFSKPEINKNKCSNTLMISNIFAAAQDSVKPVSIASESQHRVLIDQTSEQECTWQQVPPAAVAHKNVSELISIQETTSPSTEKQSVNERKRKRQPHDHSHQENFDLDQVLYM